jgi:hypothetical protein
LQLTGFFVTLATLDGVSAYAGWVGGSGMVQLPHTGPAICGSVLTVGAGTTQPLSPLYGAAIAAPPIPMTNAKAANIASRFMVRSMRVQQPLPIHCLAAVYSSGCDAHHKKALFVMLDQKQLIGSGWSLYLYNVVR